MKPLLSGPPFSVPSDAPPSTGACPVASAVSARRLRTHFVPRWPNNPYQTELARHLAAYGVDVHEDSQLKSILHQARATARRPDVIHLHALPPFRLHPVKLVRFVGFWLRLGLLRRVDAKIVWTVHNVCDHESGFPRIDRWVCRRLYRSADSVIAHSPGARALVEEQWGVVRRPDFAIIHHGHFIDCYAGGVSRTAARSRLHIPPDVQVFLFLGNIRPYKGVPQLVRDFKAIATPAMRLVIAGEVLSADLASEIRREIADCKWIDFRPAFIPDDEVTQYLGAADVVVFPYTKALTSGALILAMSFGRACVAPRMGALGDTLDAAGGFLYDPREPLALRDAMLAAMKATSALPQMGAYNLRRAERWGWGEAARATALAYRACFSTDRERRGVFNVHRFLPRSPVLNGRWSRFS